MIPRGKSQNAYNGVEAHSPTTPQRCPKPDMKAKGTEGSNHVQASLKSTESDLPTGVEVVEIKKPILGSPVSSSSSRTKFRRPNPDSRSKSVAGISHIAIPGGRRTSKMLESIKGSSYHTPQPSYHTPAPSIHSQLHRMTPTGSQGGQRGISPSPSFKSDVSQVSQRGNVLTVGAKLMSDVRLDFSEFQDSYENMIFKIPQKWACVAALIFRARNDLFNRVPKDDEATKKYFEKETEKLKEFMEEAKRKTSEDIDKLLFDVRKLYVNREHIRQELKVIMDSSGMANLMSEDMKDLTRRLKEYGDSLEREREKCHDLIKQKAEAENSFKVKMDELTKIISLKDEKISDITKEMKQFKKDLQPTKSGSVQYKEMKTLRQKAEMCKFLENRIAEVTGEHMCEKKQLEKKLEEVQTDLEEKTTLLEKERENVELLRNQLYEANDSMDKVRGERKLLTDIVDKTKNLLHQPVTTTTQREEELSSELEATRALAKGLEHKIDKIKDDKAKLIQKFERLSEDNTAQQPDRLAAEMVRKDEIIRSLKSKLSDFQRKCDEHCARYKDFDNRMKELKEKYPRGKADSGALCSQIADFKVQIINLQQTINNLTNHNDHLERSLAQRCLELEQRDQLLKQQCNLIHVKDNLINLLKKKEETYETVDTSSPNTKVLNEEKWTKETEKIHKALESEAPNLEETARALQSKQCEINDLKEHLKLLEIQNDKAQSERVRLEATISELQKKLHRAK